MESEFIYLPKLDIVVNKSAIEEVSFSSSPMAIFFKSKRVLYFHAKEAVAALRSALQAKK